MARSSRIAVFGLGYVGCVTAACFANLGNKVIGVDLDAKKVDAINSGQAPFFEPHLNDLVRGTTADGNFVATQSTREAVENSDIAFVCVGTPSAPNGDLGLDQLNRVAAQLADSLETRDTGYTVVIRSTVLPGTCDRVVKPAFASCSGVHVVSNPEFLREGSAVADFRNPSLIVVGGDPEPSQQIADLYQPLDTPVTQVALRTAELIKYACNAFHAVKISFANEIGTIAEQLEIDPLEVMNTLCLDERLNISRAYLRPGPAFGGSCLPKDLRALNYRSSRLDLRLPLLESVLGSNNEHFQRGVDKVLGLPAGRIGVFGLTFKENTDDLRESPAVRLLESLIGKGRDVGVFDPHLKLEEIFGSNRNYVLGAIPHIAKLLHNSLDEMLARCEYLVITQKPSHAHAEVLLSSGKPIVDLAGVLPAGSVRPVPA